jgi:hypothetical protein
MFRLKQLSSGKAKNHEALYNVAVHIWFPTWLTMCAVIRTVHITRLIQCVPLATEPSISLIILPLMKILQRLKTHTTDTSLFIS